MKEQPDIFMPEYAIGVGEIDLPDGQVTDVMLLEITTASTQMTVRLADADNYRKAADTLAENIRRAGASMRGPHQKLITNVRSLPDGLRKTSQGG